MRYTKRKVKGRRSKKPNILAMLAKYKDGEISTKPRKIVVDNLLRLSVSQNFDEAKSEWEYVDWIDQNTLDNMSYFSEKPPVEFYSTCQLCGQENLRYNLIIQNKINGNKLHVGTTCVIRFGVGAKDMASGKSAVQRIVDETYTLSEIRALSAGMKVLYPWARDVKQMHGHIKRYFELKMINEPTKEQIAQIMFGKESLNDVFLLNRAFDIYYEPGKLDMSRFF
ncbi:hypothetical protein EDM57_04940 [Brevibacillus gelatini]|uniref:Uncharacterized protein n=1 Tax=Brevibacillus gelatini TaxID=1655277 RepID=A0A3M8B803_9BACL|nr:hypothetical protein [Brevibacillus gelatini]RNB59490.1 hypothetical protein EDM57_04940 [Brevibacillus gelatini]